MADIDLSFYTRHKGPLLLSNLPQSFTAAWADLGTEYYAFGARHIGLWLEVDINSSQNVRVRMLGKLGQGAALEFLLPIRTVTASSVTVQDEYIEFNDDVDQNMVLSWELDGAVPYIQFQIYAGTVGGTAGRIVSAQVTAGY